MAASRFDVSFLLPADGSAGAGLVGRGAIEISPTTVVLHGRRRGLLGIGRDARDEIPMDHVADARHRGQMIAFRAVDPAGSGRVVLFTAANDLDAATIASLLPQGRATFQPAGHDDSLADRLADLTPRVIVTPVLIGLNVVVFIALAMVGVDLFRPRAVDLLHRGANFAPLTTGGEWWRLFTSMFLHFGLAHLALNMWALLSVGGLVERAYGNVFFAVLYTVAGLTGSAASILWRQDAVSAGASGAIFGVYGGLLVWLLVQKGTRLKTTLGNLATTLFFVGYNIVNGLGSTGIDNAAHLGGLVGGAAMGGILARPLIEPARSETFWPRLTTGIVVAATALLAILAFVPKSAERYRQEHLFRVEVRHFIETEKALTASLEQLMKDRRANALDDREMANRLGPLVARWDEARARVAALSVSDRSPARQHHALLLKYISLRRDEWATLAQVLRTHDRGSVEKFVALRAEAEQTLKALNAPTSKH